ncbi:hypothetical protein V7111_07535, partial [Neobacillus niacini]|uniref:hypothetical protein n=1 Tax=Neobacillus niacini TaxID=86668 RepID=UPI002FFE0786
LDQLLHFVSILLACKLFWGIDITIIHNLILHDGGLSTVNTTLFILIIFTVSMYFSVLTF